MPVEQQSYSQALTGDNHHEHGSSDNPKTPNDKFTFPPPVGRAPAKVTSQVLAEDPFTTDFPPALTLPENQSPSPETSPDEDLDSSIFIG